MIFKLKRAKASITEIKAKQSILAIIGGTKRRVVELFVTTEAALDESTITACDPLFPDLRGILKAVAARVEDGGGGFDVKAKTKVPPMLLELHPPAPEAAPPTFKWAVAECKSVAFRVDKKGDGVVRFRWKVRATKGDLEKLPDWIGADILVTCDQSQVTIEELEKRKAEEGKAPKADPKPRKKKKGAQTDLPLSGEIVEGEGEGEGEGEKNPDGTPFARATPLLGPKGSTGAPADLKDRRDDE